MISMLKKFVLVFLIQVQNFTGGFFHFSFFLAILSDPYTESWSYLLFSWTSSLIKVFLSVTSKRLYKFSLKWFLLQTVWKDRCSKSFMCAFWSFPAYENVLLCALMRLISFISENRTACRNVTGNLMTGMLSRDLAGGVGRGRGVWGGISTSFAEYMVKPFKDQKTMGI